MPRLSHDGVDDIQAWNLIFWLTLFDELFYYLNNVLIKLNSFDSSFSNENHLGSRDGRLHIHK